MKKQTKQTERAHTGLYQADRPTKHIETMEQSTPANAQTGENTHTVPITSVLDSVTDVLRQPIPARFGVVLLQRINISTYASHLYLRVRVRVRVRVRGARHMPGAGAVAGARTQQRK